jgi:ABC-type multidrug transport system ATPase subunit
LSLKITGLSKTYPNGVKALKDLTLTIGNHMFGLLGPNGAGKSTLMRTVATLQDPDSGTVQLDDLNVLTQKDEVRKVLGYLPQEFGVYPRMSALDMLHISQSSRALQTRPRERRWSKLFSSRRTSGTLARSHSALIPAA